MLVAQNLIISPNNDSLKKWAKLTAHFHPKPIVKSTAQDWANKRLTDWSKSILIIN